MNYMLIHNATLYERQPLKELPKRSWLQFLIIAI